MSAADNSHGAADPSTNGRAGTDKPVATPAGDLESISRNESGQLVVRLAGQAEPLVDARVARCFPWSMPETYISIRNKEGKEVALLKTLEGVEPATRQIILQELHDKVFNPKILRIVEH